MEEVGEICLIQKGTNCDKSSCDPSEEQCCYPCQLYNWRFYKECGADEFRTCTNELEAKRFAELEYKYGNEAMKNRMEHESL